MTAVGFSIWISSLITLNSLDRHRLNTNHTLLEARLVAGSKLTKDMSHPPASYNEGVSFPGEKQTANTTEKYSVRC